jgi:hypothetical protein
MHRRVILWVGGLALMGVLGMHGSVSASDVGTPAQPTVTAAKTSATFAAQQRRSYRRFSFQPGSTSPASNGSVYRGRSSGSTPGFHTRADQKATLKF